MSDRGIGYFIPEAHIDEVRKIAPQIKTKPGTFTLLYNCSRSFCVRGHLLRGRGAVLERLLESIEMEMQGEGLFSEESRLCALYTPSADAVSEFTDDFTAKLKQYEDTEISIINAGLLLAAISGRDVELHYNGMPVVPSYPKSDGKLHVILDASPVGELTKLRLSKMCGIQLIDNDRVYKKRGYARGYGRAIRDCDDNIIGQIIDNTIYLFLVLNHEALPLLADSKASLFHKVLAAAWNTFDAEQTEEEKIVATPLTDSEQCFQQVREWEKSGRDYIRQCVTEADEKVEEAERAYQSALAEKRLWEVAVRGHEAASEDRNSPGQREVFLEEWESLLADSRVKSVTVVEDGFHIQTNSIVLEHDAAKYMLGSFVIRLAAEAKISAWCIDSPHPARVPHPHISSTGVMCFGNLSLELKKILLIERRFARAALMILELLSEGYDPSLTLNPITEWPTES